ncbi:MAG: bleomycin resistance protein [Pseudonocardiaceae bacterium]
MASKVQARPKVTPIFPVRDMGEAREFWTRAGVEVELYDEGYAFVLADGSDVAHLRRTPHLDPERNAAACYIHVADPAVWHERWKAAGLPVTDLKVEPWGMHEFSVQDPSGNLVRVGCNS